MTHSACRCHACEYHDEMARERQCKHERIVEALQRSRARRQQATHDRAARASRKAAQMIQLHHGDCLDVLRTMPDASVEP